MTYESLAARYGVRVCTGCERGNHRLGFTDGGAVHWAPRRIHRPGLRNFLKLTAELMLGLKHAREPERTYWKCVIAEDMARTLGVRFPRRYAELDRALVRATMIGRTLDEETRTAMQRWAYDAKTD